MSDQQLNNLISMIEQIIANNLHQGDDERVSEIAADHLHKFWARSMKHQIIAYARNDDAELSRMSRITIAKLKTRFSETSQT